MSELKTYDVYLSSLGKFYEMYIKSEADKVIAELKAENNHLLSITHSERDEYIDMVNAKDKEIAELKRKLEDAQASAYAESVDAGMRERRLKRVLYKACANWAHHRVFVRFNNNEKAWENMERKCLKKTEKYK